jgi:hypothetical protein
MKDEKGRGWHSACASFILHPFFFILHPYLPCFASISSCRNWASATGRSWPAFGSRVIEGDSLLEVLCGSATIDLPAPVSGTVLERLVREEDRIVVGQRLAVIEVDAEEM